MRDQAAQSALPPPSFRKSWVSLRLDTDVLGWFRGQVREHGGGHYSTMINAALPPYIFAQGKTLEDRIRRIAREAFRGHGRTPWGEGTGA